MHKWYNENYTQLANEPRTMTLELESEQDLVEIQI